MMMHLLLFRLLGVWLLLSQLPRELSAQGSNTVKLCGRELVRAHIEICGKIHWLKSFNRGTPSLRTDTASSSNNEDTEVSSGMSESSPDFQEGVTTDGQLMKIIRKRRSETEDTRPSELENLRLDKRSRTKRAEMIKLSNKCCFYGCSLQELARGC